MSQGRQRCTLKECENENEFDVDKRKMGTRTRLGERIELSSVTEN